MFKLIYLRWLVFIAIPFIVIGIFTDIAEEFHNVRLQVMYLLVFIVGIINAELLYLANPLKPNWPTWIYIGLISLPCIITAKTRPDMVIFMTGMLVTVMVIVFKSMHQRDVSKQN